MRAHLASVRGMAICASVGLWSWGIAPAPAEAQHGGAARDAGEDRDRMHTPLAGVRPAVPYAGDARRLDVAGAAPRDILEGYTLAPQGMPRAAIDPGTMDAEAVKRQCARLLRGWQERVGAAGVPRRLEPVERDARAARVNDKWFVNYPYQYEANEQGWGEIPLSKGSDALVVLGEDGQVLAIRQRILPSGVDATEPEIAAGAAGDLGRERFEQTFPDHEARVGEPRLEVWVPGEGEQGRLSWVIEVRSDSRVDPKAVRYWISATGDGPRVLNEEFLIFHAHVGQVMGTRWETSPLQPTAVGGLAGLVVTRTGAGGGTRTTDQGGAFSFDPGSGPANFSGTLSGQFCEVRNLSGPVMSRSSSGDESVPIMLDFNASGEDDLAQVSAFYWTNRAHDFAAGIIGSSLDGLETNVNINDACNAFWDGFSINFFRSGLSCPNTAYSDVVLHEYGHGIDDRIGGILDGAYSEGYGDVVSILVTRQPCLGRDFLGPGTCLRDATEVITWPPSSPEVHHVGRIYAGFVWEFLQQLQRDGANTEDEAYEIATNLTHAAAAANPLDIPDAVFLYFLADDDDGDLSNGSPHFAALAAAADSRNIPRVPDPGSQPGPTPEPSEGCCPVVASAQFEFGQVVANADMTIASVDVSLDRPMQVQITANTSATSLGGPLLITTGFSDMDDPALMWGESLRFASFTGDGGWTNFGSTVTVLLPAGDHTLRWKIWVGGGQLNFDSGSMSVLAVPAPGISAGANGRPLQVAKGSAAARRGRDQKGNQVVRNGR